MQLPSRSACIRHLRVKEGEEFCLAEGEKVIAAERDRPYFDLIILWQAASVTAS